MSYNWSTINGTPTILNPIAANTTIEFIDNQTGSSNFYDIELLVTDSRGCSHDTSYNVELFTRPIADFSITDNGCGEVSYSPNNNTQYATSHNWTVVSSNPVFPATIVNPTDFEPAITFPENTTNTEIVYTITLTSATTNGCTDNNIQLVTIYPTPLVSFNTSNLSLIHISEPTRPY